MNVDVRFRKMNTKGVLVLNQCRGLYLVWYLIRAKLLLGIKDGYLLKLEIKIKGHIHKRTLTSPVAKEVVASTGKS